MTARTKAKLNENLELVKEYLARTYGFPVSDGTERVIYNALEWTALDVEKQMTE